jgi:Amt family ammonium transporter
MGGQIGVESEEGRGSTFWCVVPLRQPSGNAKPRSFPDELRKLRVLAVDDNATNLEILHEQFGGWGLALSTACDGPGALEALADALAYDMPFDVAILDVQMPGMDGFELARIIKNNPATRDLVLIVLTSMGQDLDAREMASLGLAAYVHKPVRQSRLLDAIVSAVAGKSLALTPETTQAAPSHERHEQGSLNVLVAEDNDVNQVVVSEILAQAGFQSTLVGNGRAAVTEALSGRYDVVLMDCQMPVMDGFEAARRIRAEEQGAASSARVPIIALTANAIKGDRERCLEAGMDGYVTKPIDAPTLIATIRTLVAEQSRPRLAEGVTKTQSDGSAAGSAPNTASEIDLEQLLARCVNNRDVAVRVLDMFRLRAQQQLEQLQQWFDAQDATAMARTAHLLKGMAGNVAAGAVAELAAALEQAAHQGDWQQMATLHDALCPAIARARQAAASCLDNLANGSAAQS